MPVHSLPDSTLQPAYLTVSAHVAQLSISRARFYDLVAEGFFLPAIFLLANKRPAYTAQMAERNKIAMMTGIGLNGQPKVFYRRRQGDGAENEQPRRRSRRSASRRNRSDAMLTNLVDSLRALGLTNVSQDQVATAVAELFSRVPPAPIETGAWTKFATATYYLALVLVLNRRRATEVFRLPAHALSSVGSHGFVGAALRGPPRWAVISIVGAPGLRCAWGLRGHLASRSSSPYLTSGTART